MNNSTFRNNTLIFLLLYIGTNIYMYVFNDDTFIYMQLNIINYMYDFYVGSDFFIVTSNGSTYIILLYMYLFVWNDDFKVPCTTCTCRITTLIYPLALHVHFLQFCIMMSIIFLWRTIALSVTTTCRSRIN